MAHASDCALHNAPAFEPGDCDCGDPLDIKTAVAAEREACAKIAESLRTLKAALPTGPNGQSENAHVTIHGIEIAAAIRARNNP